MSKKNIIQFAIALVAMSTGGVLYLLWRPDNLLMFEWVEYLNLSKIVYTLRSMVEPIHLPFVVVYSFPHALWYLSGILIFAIIWRDNKRMQYLWIAIMTAMCFGGEFGQLIGVVPGNFNLDDILYSIIAGFIALAVNYKLGSQNEKQT